MKTTDPDTERGLYGKYRVWRERREASDPKGPPNITIHSDPGECFVLAYETGVVSARLDR